MFEPLVPLVEDEASAVPTPPGMVTGATRNFIDDEETMTYVRDNLPSLLRRTRDDRRSLEYDWQEIRRCDMLKHDYNRKYIGRSDAYLPIARKNFDTLVSNLSTGLFPTDDNLDVINCSPDTPDQPPGVIDDKARKVKALLEWEFNENAQVQRKMKPFLRQFVQFGNSVGKYRYRQVNAGGAKGQRISLDSFGNIGAVTQALDVDGCEFTTRSLFRWHIYPLSAASLEEAILIFEDIDVPLSFIKRKVEEGEWPEEAQWVTPVPEADQADRDLRTNMDLVSNVNSTAPVTGELGQMRTLTECWLRLKLPKEAYFPGEDTDQPVPCKVVMAYQQPIEIRRNPFWDQKPPYVVTRMNVQQGIFYGEGFGKAVQSAQYLANDFINQTNDNGIYALNPIIKYNPALMTGPLRPLGPGAAYAMSDPAGLTFDRPPSDQIQTGLQLTQTFMGYAQDLGGAPPVLQGNKAASTATSSQILQKNASVPLQDIVRDIEDDVIVPLLKAFWLLNQQFRTDQVMVSTMGEVIRVTPQDLAINATFRWLASNQTLNAQQRSQNAVQYLQTLINPATLQLLQANGKMVDPTDLLHRIYTDGLGLRGFDNIVKQAPPPPPMMGPGGPGMPPGAPGMPPGPSGAPPPGMPPGDRARSALEQIGAPQGQMAPGEGEAFGEVRDNADQLAADGGGANLAML